MQKKILLFLTLILLSAPLAIANEWKEVAKGVYVKKDTMEKRFYKRSQALVRFYNDGTFKSIKGQKVKYSDNFLVIQCHKNKISLKEVYNYNYKKSLINSFIIKDYKARFLPFAPKSKGRYVRNYVCGKTRGM